MHAYLFVSLFQGIAQTAPFITAIYHDSWRSCHDKAGDAAGVPVGAGIAPVACGASPVGFEKREQGQGFHGAIARKSIDVAAASAL